MLIVKMMSGEDMRDSDNRKSYKLVSVREGTLISFYRDDNNWPVLSVDGVIYHLQGNVYVMENGRTISTFAYNEAK